MNTKQICLLLSIATAMLLLPVMTNAAPSSEKQNDEAPLTELDKDGKPCGPKRSEPVKYRIVYWHVPKYLANGEIEYTANCRFIKPNNTGTKMVISEVYMLKSGKEKKPTRAFFRNVVCKLPPRFEGAETELYTRKFWYNNVCLPDGTVEYTANCRIVSKKDGRTMKKITKTYMLESKKKERAQMIWFLKNVCVL